MTIKKSVYKISFLAILFALLDQFSKWGAQAYLNQSVEFFPWFKLVLHQNYGIAWGISLPYWLLLTMNFILLALVPYLAFRSLEMKSKLAAFCVGITLGGALGNVVDRVYRGYVVDFIAIGSWPVFNLADAFLCIGIFLIFLFYAKIKRN